MRHSEIISTLKDLLQRKSTTNLPLVAGKYPIYIFQEFWKSSYPLDHFYQLTKEECIFIFSHLFEQKWYNNSKERIIKCPSEKITKDKNYQKIIHLLAEKAPHQFTQFIKHSQVFLKKDFLDSFNFLEKHSNKELREFWSIMHFLHIKNNKLQAICIKQIKRLEQYDSLEVVYWLVNILFPIDGFPHPPFLDAFNEILRKLMTSEKFKVKIKQSPFEENLPLQNLVNECIKWSFEYSNFKSSLVDVFSYDDNIQVILNNDKLPEIKILDNLKHQIWEKNGKKHAAINDYYDHKSYFFCNKHNIETGSPTFLKTYSNYYLKDYGLKNYNIPNQSFKVEEVIYVLSVIKVVAAQNYYAINYSKIDDWNDLLVTNSEEELSKEKIQSILEYLAFDSTKSYYFDVTQTPLIKQGDYLILINGALQQINAHVPLINRILAPENPTVRDSSIAERQAELVAKSLNEKGFKCISEMKILDHKSGIEGEIDVAAYDGNSILIIELKATHVRSDLKERHFHAKQALKKANSQLQNIKSKLEDADDPKYLDWLKNKLGVSVDTTPSISYLIVSTSFEWDELDITTFPKIGLFTILHILRNDRFLLFKESMNLSLNSPVHSYYPENLTLDKLMKIIKEDDVWKHLNPEVGIQ